MRILILHDFGRRIGGAEHLSLLLRDALRGRGHEARLLSSDADVMRRDVPLPVEADAAFPGVTGPLQRLTRVANPIAARAVRREVASFRPDVVHVRMFLEQFSPLALPELAGVPALLHVVNYLPICPLDTKTLPDGSPCPHRPGMACHRAGCLPWLGGVRVAAQHGLMRRHFGVFGDVVANSRWVMGKLRADGLRCDGFVWNGVPEVAPRPPLGGPPTVGFAGRLVSYKGVDVLVRAWPAVLARVPGARLVVAGDGPERGSLGRLAARLGVGDSVEFAGHLPQADLEPRMGRAWVQAVPSTWEEPFGLVCAEAMMRGTAVVASNSGGLAEQVVDGGTGLLAPPGDVAAWASALSDLLSDRPRCESLGNAGRERARSLLTHGRFVDAFLARYGALLARNTPPARAGG